MKIYFPDEVSMNIISQVGTKIRYSRHKSRLYIQTPTVKILGITENEIGIKSDSTQLENFFIKFNTKIKKMIINKHFFYSNYYNNKMKLKYDKNEIYVYDKEKKVELKKLKEGIFVKMIIYPENIWDIDKKWGVSWNIDQILLSQKPEKPFSFRKDELKADKNPSFPLIRTQISKKHLLHLTDFDSSMK